MTKPTVTFTTLRTCPKGDTMQWPKATYFNSQLHNGDQTQVLPNKMKHNISPFSHKDQYMLLPDPAESTHTYLSNDLGVKLITSSSSACSYNRAMKPVNLPINAASQLVWINCQSRQQYILTPVFISTCFSLYTTIIKKITKRDYMGKYVNCSQFVVFLKCENLRTGHLLGREIVHSISKGCTLFILRVKRTRKNYS
jgi:hypothetical protein